MLKVRMKDYQRQALKLLTASIILAFLFRGPLRAWEEEALRFVRPLQWGVGGAASFVREQALFFSSLRKLARKNKELKKRVWELENELDKLEEFEQENKELRKLLSLSVQGDTNILPAKVISWDSLSSGGLLLINRGEGDGVKVGMAVIYKGFLIGRILKAGGRSSYVRVTYHPSFRTSAVVSRLGEASLGLVQGYMPGKMIMKDIYSDVPLETGDEIITSGKEEKMPGGLVLGKVREIREEGVLKEAVVSLPVELRSLNEVFILQ